MSSTKLLSDAALTFSGASPSSSSHTRLPVTYDPELPDTFFSRRSHSDLVLVNHLIKFIRRKCSVRDQDLGVVYVLQAREVDLVKVGYTTTEDLSRVQQIMENCHVHIFKMYDTPLFRGAFRAEQIVHRLLQQWGYNRHRCPCGKKANREWFHRPFEQVVGVVNMVFAWLNTQQPYDSESRELRPVWKEALHTWRETQDTQEPLEWMDFFLMNENYPRARQLFTKQPPFQSSNRPRGGVSQLATTPEKWQRIIESQREKWRRQQDRLNARFPVTPSKAEENDVLGTTMRRHDETPPRARAPRSSTAALHERSDISSQSSTDDIFGETVQRQAQNAGLSTTTSGRHETDTTQKYFDVLPDLFSCSVSETDSHNRSQQSAEPQTDDEETGEETAKATDESPSLPSLRHSDSRLSENGHDPLADPSKASTHIEHSSGHTNNSHEPTSDTETEDTGEKMPGSFPTYYYYPAGTETHNLTLQSRFKALSNPSQPQLEVHVSQSEAKTNEPFSASLSLSSSSSSSAAASSRIAKRPFLTVNGLLSGQLRRASIATPGAAKMEIGSSDHRRASSALVLSRPKSNI